MRASLGLHKEVFDRLIEVLEAKGGLISSRWVTAGEKLAIFLSLCRNAVGVQAFGDRFQRATNTVSRQVIMDEAEPE